MYAIRSYYATKCWLLHSAILPQSKLLVVFVIYQAFIINNNKTLQTEIMTKISSLVEKVNGGQNPLFHELYGTDEAVLKGMADRYVKYMEQYSATYGSDDVTLFSSPGRTEVGGNHTDHQLGRVLAGAVNLDNIAVAAPNGTNIVRIDSVGFPPFEVDLSDLEITEFKVTPGNLVITSYSIHYTKLYDIPTPGYKK